MLCGGGLVATISVGVPTLGERTVLLLELRWREAPIAQSQYCVVRWMTLHDHVLFHEQQREVCEFAVSYCISCVELSLVERRVSSKTSSDDLDRRLRPEP